MTLGPREFVWFELTGFDRDKDQNDQDPVTERSKRLKKFKLHYENSNNFSSNDKDMIYSNTLDIECLLSLLSEHYQSCENVDFIFSYL